MLLDDIDDEHHTINSELLAELARFFLDKSSRKKSEVAQRAKRNKGDQPRHRQPSRHRLDLPDIITQYSPYRSSWNLVRHVIQSSAQNGAKRRRRSR
jgi:hypothetical protein